MRLIKETPKTNLPKNQAAKLFVESWYSMVHRNSIDSHRVRCMNLYNIFIELQSLISKKKIIGDKIVDDIKRVAEESLEILQNDFTVKKYYLTHAERIEPLLNTIIGAKKEDEKSTSLVSHYIKDLLLELNKSYKLNLIREIENAINNTKIESDIYNYTCSLLSKLLDEGYSLEGLFALIQNIFISNDPKYNFNENFEFAKKVIIHEKSEYEIIFKLEGFKKSPIIPLQIGKIQFHKKIEINDGSNDNITCYLNPGQNILFSKIKISAEDDRSAGQKASEELESILDLIRFELESETIKISQEFISIRISDNSQKVRIYRLPSQIPNPKRNIDSLEFSNFLNIISNIIDNDNISKESKDKIRSAFRFYRMGRDSEQFENKFLNWWTALEYLARTGSRSSIICDIENILVSSLVLNYLEKHLLSYKNTFIFCGIRPTDICCEKYGITDFEGLNLADLLMLLRNNDEVKNIKKQLITLPLVDYKLRIFQKQIKNPESLNCFLDRHKKHLCWHIYRLYRVRCDIVHSAEYSFNLTLLCANLEYYLKSLLSIVLQELNNNQMIESLSELFNRTNYTFEKLCANLQNGKEDIILDVLRRRGV